MTFETMIAAVASFGFILFLALLHQKTSRDISAKPRRVLHIRIPDPPPMKFARVGIVGYPVYEN